MDSLLLLVALVYALAASWLDLRERKIPNALNAGAFALVFLAAFFNGFFANQLGVWFVVFIAVAFAFSFAIYLAGAWAGGDAKFFTVLAAWAFMLKPVSGWESVAVTLVFLFLASVVLFVPFAAFVYAKELKKLKTKETVVAALKTGAKEGVVLAVLAFAFALLFNPANALAAGATGFSFACAFSVLAGYWGLLREKVFVFKARVEEGVVPAVSLVKAGGKVKEWKMPGVSEIVKGALKGALPAVPKGVLLADASKARGLTSGEVKQLKANGVKLLAVKRTLAFAPALAGGFVAWVLLA